ncbi:unnamed protein product [Paramecium sonneborni]|uniref:Tetratricopeptide repeat protein n=1 Tax=Paramecium sonneborni TaxID=65129 RepID=A0A8S1QI30_9CILI|nr:unnamed protein product [Paramecium sonneborni]
MNCFLEAITSCDNAIKVNPTAYLALNYKALALIMLGYADEALINCQQSLQINKKNNLDAYLLITFTLNKKSQFQQARIYCDQAIYDEIRSANIYNNKGFALLNLKDYNGAIQCFQEAIKINPQSDEAFSNMGDSLSYLNQFEAAINNYDYAYQISNNDKYKVKQLTLELELEKSQIKSILNY